MRVGWVASRRVRAVAEAASEYLPEIAGLLGAVFVVWRMLTYYEKRNADAHAELGRRIDAVAGDVKYMRAVLDTLPASFKQ